MGCVVNSCMLWLRAEVSSNGGMCHLMNGVILEVCFHWDQFLLFQESS